MTVNALSLSLPEPMAQLIRSLEMATKPKQTKKVESLSAAGRAYAREQGDYESYVNATYVYIMARRRTTELYLPHFKQGRPKKDNTHVMFLADAGFTAQQWNRRVKELEIPVETIEDYFDECKANGWHPSLNGMVSFARHGDNRPSGRSSFDIGELYSEFAKMRKTSSIEYHRGAKDFAEFLMNR